MLHDMWSLALQHYTIALLLHATTLRHCYRTTTTQHHYATTLLHYHTTAGNHFTINASPPLHVLHKTRQYYICHTSLLTLLPGIP